jgi:hypothetical protein
MNNIRNVTFYELMTKRVQEMIVENQREGFVKSDRNYREWKDIFQKGKKSLDVVQKAIDEAKKNSDEELAVSAQKCLDEQLILVDQIGRLISNYERLKNMEFSR